MSKFPSLSLYEHVHTVHVHMHIARVLRCMLRGIRAFMHVHVRRDMI